MWMESFPVIYVHHKSFHGTCDGDPISCPVHCRSKKGKSGERAELIDNDRLARSSPAPGSLFPKVQMKSDVGQVNRASNMYEDEEEEYRRSMPKRDYDEVRRRENCANYIRWGIVKEKI